MGSPDSEMLGTTLLYEDVTMLGIVEVTDLGSIDVSFDNSNDDKLECALLGDSLGTDDGTVLGSFDGDFDDNNNNNLDGSTLVVSLESTY